jgi:hypothetical protein
MALGFVPGPPDAALVLQAAVTKTESFDSAWLDMGRGFYPGGLGMPAAAVVNVSAVTTGAGLTYAVKLQETDEDEDGNPDATKIRDTGLAVSVTGTGLVVAKGFITARYVRLSLAAAGATASITYDGHLNP